MRDAITAQEREAIEAHLGLENRKQEAAHEAEKTIEDRYLDAFTAMTEGNKTIDLMGAFATIAAFFHNDDPEFHVGADFDGVTGERIPGSDNNNAQFNQKGLMSQLCQQANWMLEREEKRLHWLRNAAQRARRAEAGGEIDTLARERAELDYGRCKYINLPMLEQFKRGAKAAYLTQYGEDWTRPVKQDTRRTTEQLDDRFSHRSTVVKL